jgi:septum site-determining protein MinD
MTRTIAIISGKGGVGKTTISLNLASALATYCNRKTTVVDCNLTTSHLGLYLGSYHFPVTLNDVLRGEAEMDQAVYVVENGMNIVPASVSLRDLDGIDIFYLKEKVAELTGKTDFVFLDSAPGLGREAVGALKACDEYIFVANPNLLSVTDVIRCNEVCQEIGIKPVGTVINMVHRDRYEIPWKEIERLTGVPVIASIPFDHDVRKSMALKAPLVSIKPDHKISRQIINLSAFLAGYQMPRRGFDFRRALKFW